VTDRPPKKSGPPTPAADRLSHVDPLDRRRSARRSSEPDSLYRVLVEAVRDYAIFALDATGHILSWNAGAERLKGYTPDEIIGRHFSTFYQPDDVAADRPGRLLAAAAREGRVEDEGWRVRKDGSRFWADVIITALRDESGGVIGYAKVTRDLTERRRVEDALRDSEERFRLLVQNVRDYGIFVLDPEGNVASWNAGARAITGYTSEEIVGRHFSTFYTEQDRTSGKPPWELRVAAAEGRFEEEGWRLRTDGTQFWSNVVITALRDDNDRLIGFAKVTRDLTERREAQERALAEARRAAAAEGANRTKSEFLAAMSHELRTPLNAIGGYADLLEMGLRGPVTEEQRADLQRIRRSQQHLLGIINDILNYSRMEAGKVAFVAERLPLESVADSVLPMLEPQLHAKGLTLHRGICDPNAVAHADRAKVEQILVNLLSNASKFTPEGGRVSVECDVNGGAARIWVSDTGPGVPEDKREAIFEPFVQLGRSLTTAHEGTGLGLAISRDLARAMGGDLRYSDRGPGASFVLELPLDEQGTA
jgi:PAS domain S-box-containing protein